MSNPDVGAPIDANGNLTGDGTRTFEWDARNQLVAVIVGTQRTEFTYDGLQQRVRVVDKENGIVQSDTKVVWCDEQICEERAADGVTVTRRAFSQGEQIGIIARFFATDHLRSVTEVTDGSATLLARYAFDPWGRQTVTAGTDVTTVGYTGHRRSAGGWAAWFRTFDSETGRWLSEDPGVRYATSYGVTALPDGPNLFAYSRNNPVRFTDPAGLQTGAETATWPWVVKTCVSVGTAAAALLGAAIGAALMQCGDGCGQKKGKYHCTAKCHINNFSNLPNIPDFVTGEGWGNSIGEEQLAAEKDANTKVPRGTYKRHCGFKCEQR
jgi:RHS repeat-associated protein